MNSLTSIKYALVSFVLTMAIIILSYKVIENNSEFILTLIAFLSFIIIILSFIGLVKSVKKMKENKTFVIFFSFLINLTFLIIYAYLIISKI